MAVLSKITIIGAGVLSPDQLTLEAVRAMQGSSIIYYLLDTNPKLEAYLAKLGPELVDLGYLYEEGL